MGSLSIWHWLIVLLIVVLVFGTKKISGLGKDLGSAVRGFREGMKEGAVEEKAGDAASTPQKTAQAEPPIVPLPEKEVRGGSHVFENKAHSDQR